MASKSYLRLGEDPNPNLHIIATFYLETDENLLDIAEAVAGESSIGTWTSLSTMTDEIFSRLAPKIHRVKRMDVDNNKDTKEGIIKIAYPLDLWEEGSLPQVLSAVAGNVFGMKAVKNLRLLDLELPDVFIDSFEGPAMGIEGVRDLIEIHNRPLIGTIVKPKCGLSSDQHAEVAYQAWKGGCDIVKDDENLTNQGFNPFEERVKKTLELRKKAEKETGRNKVYVINITATADEMLERAKFAKAHGARCVMIDILTAGFSGVQFIRKQNLGMIMHGHRAMHAAFTNNPRHGISMLTVAKIARLAGIDQLHTGTVIGKMEGEKKSVRKINEVMTTPWHGIKRTLPIASGGLHPGHSVKLVQILGKEFIANYGGGIHGHPNGTYEGAKAAHQSIIAAMEGKSLRQFAQEVGNDALSIAIDKWGIYGEEKEEKQFTYNYPLLTLQHVEI